MRKQMFLSVAKNVVMENLVEHNQTLSLMQYIKALLSRKSG